MIEKDLAIALRLAPYSNTSRFVLWLSREHGKIATMIKGAQRPKSAFLGQFDLFYTCELLFYGRDRGGVFIARECSPMKMRTPLRARWRACQFASYFADLVARALPDGARALSVFDWLDAALDELAAEGASTATVFRRELGFLEHLGFRPILNRCAGCGGAAAETPNAAFSPSRGGRLCARCAPSARDARNAPADALDLLALWQTAPDDASARCTARQSRAMEVVLGDFLRHHLDLDLQSRRLAFRNARPLPRPAMPVAPVGTEIARTRGTRGDRD